MLRTLADVRIDKLEEFLLTMSPGDELNPRRAAEISGLNHKECGAVLEALTRVGLMVRLQNDVFVRCRLEASGRQ